MVKHCKLCGGNPKWVYYAIPESDEPDLWHECSDPDEEPELVPLMLFKRLECTKCGATTNLHISLDEARDYWNSGCLVVRYGEEECLEGDQE